MNNSQPMIPIRNYLVSVFILSFGLIFLETIFFHLLKYVSYYLEASSIISIALLGISLGGFAAFYFKRRAGMVLPLSVLLFPVVILSSFFAITYFSAEISKYSWLLIPPFFFASLVISITFIFLPAYKVYFVSLLGGAAGVLFLSPMLRYLGEENSIFFITAFMFCGCFPFFGTLKSISLKRIGRGVVVLFILCLVGLMIINKDRRYLNLPYMVRDTGFQRDTMKISFDMMKPRAKVLASASSLAGRVDILRYYEDGRNMRTKNYDHGLRIDTLRNRPQETYDYDPRLPKGFLKDPDVLIIGPAGEGVTKSSKNLGNGKVTAVEINPAMVEVMSGPMDEFTHHSYKGIEMHIMDGRTFIRQTSRKFDIITLLNSYLGYGLSAGKQAVPEYLHTTEAIVEYLDHLTERGFIMFEEMILRRDPGRAFAILKLLNTVLKAFERLGVENPREHFFVYEWSSYVQIIVKKEPLTTEDDQFLIEWMRRTSDMKNRKFFFRVKSLVYSPFHPPQTAYGNFIASEGRDYPLPLSTDQLRKIVKGKESFELKFNVSPTTDNRPFPFDVFPKREAIKSVFWRIAILAFLLTLIPPFIIFMIRYRARATESVPYFLYFGLLGIGYLLVEIVLMQKFQIYLGSPTYSFAGVLVIMLFMSSIGSWFCNRLKGRRILLAFVAIPILLHLLRSGLDPIFSATSHFSLAGKIALAFLLIAPVSFFMGMPFPFGLESSKRRFSAEYAALMLAVNGGFCAIGIPLSFLSSTSQGFSFTFILGILAYLLAAGALFIGRLDK